MSGKSSRKVRAKVYWDAVDYGLWDRCAKVVYDKGWRRLWVRLFPILKVRYDKIVGKMYKYNLEKHKGDVQQAIKDQDMKEYARVRQRIETDWIRRRLAAGKVHVVRG